MALAKQVFLDDGTARNFIVPAGVFSVKVTTERTDGIRQTPADKLFDGSGDLVGLGGTAGFSILDANGSLWSWGPNAYGEAGIGSSGANLSTPTMVTGAVTQFVSIWGRSPFFGLGKDGAMYSWGINTSGQGGVGTITNNLVPTIVAGPKLTKIFPAMNNGNIDDQPYGFTGYAIAYGNDEAGLTYAWGNNFGGALGVGDTVSRSIPTQMSGGYQFTKVWPFATSGWGAQLGTGLLYAWGSNANGQLGIGSQVSVSSPTLVVGNLSPAVLFSNSNFQMCIDTAGNAWSWGLNNNGQCGINSTTPTYVTLPVQWNVTGKTWRKPLATNNNIAWLATDGTLWSAGANTYGQLGDGTITPRSTPTAIAGPALNFSNVLMGLTSMYGLTTGGQVYAWGNNANGQLGLNDQVSRSTPTLIASLSGITKIQLQTGNTDSVFAYNASGQVWSWGYNNGGMLGNLNINTQTSSPILVAGPKKWSQLFYTGTTNAFVNVLGVATDGTLWTWGNGPQGSLGTGSLVNSSSPVAVLGNKTALLKPYLEVRIVPVVPGQTLPVIFQSNIYLGTTAVGNFGQKITVEYDQ